MLPTMVSRRRERASSNNDLSGDTDENEPFISDSNPNNNGNNPLFNDVIFPNNNGFRAALNLNLENVNISPRQQLYGLVLCVVCIVGCICSFWVFISIAQIIALCTEWHTSCDVPLQKWLLVSLLLPVVFGVLYLSLILFVHNLPNTYATIADRRRYRLILQKMFSNRTEVLLYSFWILQGYNWWSKSSTCHQTAPVLYYVTCLSLWVSGIRLAAQLICQCCIRVCNPILIESLRRNGLIDPNAGSQQALDSFYNRLFVDNFTRGTPINVINSFAIQVFDGNDIEAQHNEVENHGDNNRAASSCAICLALFENGEELRVLPCSHSFHSDCIDTWLGGHRTCPMCRIDVISQRR